MKKSWGITSYATFFIALAGLLFSGSFFVSPRIALANNGGFTIPPCAFTPMSGRTIVNFPASKLKNDNLIIGPVWVPIPAGTYKVSLMSWDGYENRKNAIQNDEQWYVAFRDVSGDDVANSAVTDDLADGVEEARFIGVVNASLDIPRDAAKVVAKHAKLYGAYEPDSLYAVCAAFDLISLHTPLSMGVVSTTSENSKPVITRLGDNPVTMFEGDAYTDAGATASDQEDGNITSSIVRGGAIVTSSTPKGNYTITYDVSDSHGLAATQVTRLVIVQPKLGEECRQCGGGGTVDDPLYITNEKIQVNGTSAVLTWDTTVSATSLVAFGTTSVKTLTLDSDFGYGTTTQLYASTTKSHTVAIENLTQNIVYYFRPTSKRDAGAIERAVGIELSTLPTVTTATTIPTGTPTSSPVPTPMPVGIVSGECFEYLRAFIKFGANNDRVEVLKLQSFLRTFEGTANVPLSGIYDTATRDAVNAFQEKYRDDVLTPWGLTSHTGYVYITTKRQINTVYCSYKKDFALTAGQKTEIAAYRAEIERMRKNGVDVSAAGLNNLPDTEGATSKSAWEAKNQSATSSKHKKDVTTAVIEAFEGMLKKDTATSTSAMGTKSEKGKLSKVAAAITASINPSKWMQLLLIAILFIVGFLLYRSGSKEEDDHYDDDDGIPPFGKPNMTSESKEGASERETNKEVSKENRAEPRITLEQLKDNLVLKREDTASEKTGEAHVIQL